MSRSERRFDQDVQLEFCALCGRKVAAAKRVLGTAQGFYGQYVCPEHADWAVNPSFIDYGGVGNSAPLPEPLEPHSGQDWIADALGAVTYSSFYAGAVLGQSPATTTTITTQTRAIPFVLPRRLSSYTVTNVAVSVPTIPLGTGPLEVAIYVQTGDLDTPGVLVADLGDVTSSAGAVWNLPANLFLAGDAVYFLLYRFNGSAAAAAFSPAASSGLTMAPLMARPITGTFAVQTDWPDDANGIPWLQMTGTSFPAFVLTVGS